uniref:Uncharacterized protein n=1 Tax=Trichobilharzia regenti TaxID=157069 RepID=A0AA85IPS4_TRIRE|nr:unnamed protein product [Trichobilharzia regenti]
MHLKQGDPKPEFRSDRLTLIGYRFCPYVDRVKLITGPTYMLLSSPQISDGDVAHYWEACSKLNDAIKGPYFAGHDLSLADLLIFPHLQRFETIVGRINGKDLNNIGELNGNDELRAKWPKLTGYLDAMRKKSFVAESVASCQLIARFVNNKHQGKDDPDIE